jgi:vacuolar-type H+-ATPase subunit I/STV1
MELDLRELQKEVDDMRTGAETLEALKQGYYHYAEDDGTLEALKQGAGDYELQKRVDEMRELQTLIDDLRAGDKTLEALSLSHYELQQMVDDMREMCADGSAGGVGILEEQMNTLQKIGDEMRAGETLEALKQGILNRKQIIGEGTMVLQDYARGEFIKVHTAEIEQDPGGQIIKVHTAEIEQDPNKVEGGKGDILISANTTAEQKPVARGLIDPGGGANTYMYAGEGKILYPEITGTWTRNNPGEGQGIFRYSDSRSYDADEATVGSYAVYYIVKK